VIAFDLRRAQQALSSAPEHYRQWRQFHPRCECVMSGVRTAGNAPGLA
jgi:hypothetical protein